MASLNRVILAGNLTRDPEVRYTPTGTAVADLGLAVNDRVKKDNEWVEKPTFIDVTVWGRQAETTSEYLQKGSPVLIEGRLQLDSWETKEGEKRNKLKVVAERVQFLGSPKKGGQQGDAPDDFVSGPPTEPEAAPVRASTSDEDDLPF